MKQDKIIAFIFAFAFFAIALITLPDYGINWDTINHLPRGQVYLHYFLTGSKDYSDLPPYFQEWQKSGEWYWQKENSLLFAPDIPKSKVPSISLYQRAGVDFSYFMQRDGGHPPLSDVLSSAFNLILFQKFRLINDIDSYRIYGVVLAASLVGLIYFWIASVSGKVAGFFAALSLSLYPLFWSESHFNTEKDIPETVYWSFLLFCLWNGVKEKSWKWILASGLFFGLALGTKFNILFVGFVILPWLVLSASRLLKQRWFLISSFTAVILGFAIFIASWPYLWADPIARILKVAGFYKEIGLGDVPGPAFLGPFGINTYPILGIAYTTPVVILALSIIGLWRAIKERFSQKNGVYLLFVLWLLVPILRVTWPGTTIYGGLRQIMEFIPALAIMSGLGAAVIYKFISTRFTRIAVLSILILPFIFLALGLAKIHPNENVYFNSLIGGLSGAKRVDFPFWGNSFGAAYRQAAGWINENAQEGSNVVYAYELIPNIPRIWLRTDLNLHNSNRSGYLRKGEYIVTLPYRGTETRSYFDMYLRKFLKPVYESKVDGVPVVTVWKNDEANLIKPWIENQDRDVLVEKTDGAIEFDLGEERSISRLEVRYSQNNCSDLTSGSVSISNDRITWKGLPGALPQDWLIPVLGQQPKEGGFIYPFTGQPARFIRVEVSPVNTCLKNIQNFVIYYFVDDAQQK